MSPHVFYAILSVGMYKRIVVKIGTKVITTDKGKLDLDILRRIIDQIVQLRKQGLEVILVTSGAVGAGRGLLAIKESKEVVQKQVFAAVGQVKLMSIYAKLFENYRYVCGQVLVTKEDFRDKKHYFNMRNCLKGLLQDRVIPIVNENDVVATTELLFTDNDELAGLIASQLNADAVIILTNVNGVLAGDPRDSASRVIAEIDFRAVRSAEKHVTPQKSAFGRGGMLSKFAVAKKLSAQGIITYIANGRNKNVITDILEGKEVGTKFLAKEKPTALKRRLAHSEGFAKGAVYVNKCTEDILVSKTKIISLLPVGITRIDGNFTKGDTVEIRTETKEKLGFGVAQYSSEKANELKGKKNARPVIHYNYMFIG